MNFVKLTNDKGKTGSENLSHAEFIERVEIGDRRGLKIFYNSGQQVVYEIQDAEVVSKMLDEIVGKPLTAEGFEGIRCNKNFVPIYYLENGNEKYVNLNLIRSISLLEKTGSTATLILEMRDDIPKKITGDLTTLFPLLQATNLILQEEKIDLGIELEDISVPTSDLTNFVDALKNTQVELEDGNVNIYTPAEQHEVKNTRTVEITEAAEIKNVEQPVTEDKVDVVNEVAGETNAVNSNTEIEHTLGPEPEVKEEIISGDSTPKYNMDKYQNRNNQCPTEAKSKSFFKKWDKK